MRQPGLGAGMGDVVGELVARLAGRLARHDADAHQHLDVFGPAPGRDDLRPQGTRRAPRRLLVGRGDEDAFGVARREALPPSRGPGLEQDRRALPRRLGEMVALGSVEGPLVADRVDLRRIGIDPGRAVSAHGVVVPARLPELVEEVEVVVGAVVAAVVLREAVLADRPGGRCRDSPSRRSSRCGHP